MRAPIWQIVWRIIWYLPISSARGAFCILIFIGYGWEQAKRAWEATE